MNKHLILIVALSLGSIITVISTTDFVSIVSAVGNSKNTCGFIEAPNDFHNNPPSIVAHDFTVKAKMGIWGKSVNEEATSCSNK